MPPPIVVITDILIEYWNDIVATTDIINSSFIRIPWTGNTLNKRSFYT